MSWIPSSFITTMQSLLSSSESDQEQTGDRMEDIRQAMLDTLDRDDWDNYYYLERQIMCVPDLMDLWFLRSDLMYAISTVHGEMVSGQILRTISNMFDGLLPKNMATRPSPLGNC
jgi:hypothetical protein